LGSNWVTVGGSDVRTFLFHYSLGPSRIKVVGEPDYDGWARVLLHINAETGEVRPGDTRPHSDVLWMPGLEPLLKSGHVEELT
jgi:hypothetical protein